MADGAERKMIHAWRDRAIRAEAERDALLRVARAAYGTTGDAAFAALPAALLAKVKGGNK